MRPFCLTLWCCAFCLGCTAFAPKPASQAAGKTGDALVREANAMIDSINARVSERDLVATVASEHVALLNMRAEKLRIRSKGLDPKSQAALEPHLNWLDEVHATAMLSIGVLRNESRDFEADKAEVLLWAKTFDKEIESLERRMERASPAQLLFSERPRPAERVLSRGAGVESGATRGTGTRRAARLRGAGSAAPARTVA